MPPFALFFEEQAEVKREQAKQLLRYLRKREGMICLPVFKVIIILLFCNDPDGVFSGSRKELIPSSLVSLLIFLHGLLKTDLEGKHVSTSF
jgi:hypothetical protein